MRSYIRHPSDIPIEVIPEGITHPNQHQLRDFSHGGLSFFSDARHQIGSGVKIRIAIVKPAFEVTGIVKWCHPVDDLFEIGLEFLDPQDSYKARMVEQICHIEHYKNEVLIKEGRKLTGQQAALEWIRRFASEFPPISTDKAVND